ncbi:MAG TPA: EutP/PduV family microcompartment system protein [Arachnia sp.]|nr:EutP/PduV family microcompartment system protein [Arachnia sp.]
MTATSVECPSILLVGSVGSGKTTFRQRLRDEDIEYVKTQAIEAFDGIVDTPGEFLQHGRLRSALQVVAFDVDLVVLMVDPTTGGARIPPGFATSFNRDVIGVVTKTDLATAEEIEAASVLLREAGASPVLHVDSVSGAGFGAVREVLCPS